MKYFSLSRPIVPGGYPKVAKVIEVINFDTPIIQPEIGHTVWGTIEFDTEIPAEDAEAYELIADKKQEFLAVTTSFDDRGHNANSIILFHNHPSGNFLPSREDRAVTQMVCKAGKLLGIPVLDHIIVGKSDCYSFKDHNEDVLTVK